jgi:hypothetical protein
MEGCGIGTATSLIGLKRYVTRLDNTQNATKHSRYATLNATSYSRYFGAQTLHATLLGTQYVTLYSLPKHTPAAPRCVGNSCGNRDRPRFEKSLNGAQQRYKQGGTQPEIVPANTATTGLAEVHYALRKRLFP